MISLQGPDKTYALDVSLKLVAEIEAACGSLYTLAEEVLEKSLPVCELLDIVKTLYRHAGCEAEEAFLLRQPCAEILAGFLLEVLEPIERPPLNKILEETTP